MEQQLAMFGAVEEEPLERQVGRWTLRRGIPMERDAQERHHAKAQRPSFPFDQMQPGECFDAWPHEVGEDDLLRAANVVSSAASAFKRKEADKGNAVHFKTAQKGGRFVRCWRAY